MPLMPVLTAARAFDPRRENVHPVFDPSRFASNIDYYGAIYDSAVLATRLMNTPQALQHDYCFYYGKNRLANDPAKYVPSDFSNGPCLYACDKAIGELDETDIRHVEHQRLRLVMKLSDDDFWEADSGEYIQQGAFALIPDCVPPLCEPENEDTHLYEAIPLSIRDLFKTEGPSYAKRMYASYANPERQLRTRPGDDYRFKKVMSAD